MPNEDPKSDQKLQVLLEEYKLVNDKIEMFIHSEHKYLNTSLALLGGFLVFTVTSNSTQYIPYIPVLCALILGFIGYHYQRNIGIQGYKIYLEKMINGHVGLDLVSYTQIGMVEMVKKNRFGAFNLIIYIGVYAFLCYFAFTLSDCMPGKIIWAGVHLLIFIILVVAALPIQGYSRKVTAIAEKKYNESLRKAEKAAKTPESDDQSQKDESD